MNQGFASDDDQSNDGRGRPLATDEEMISDIDDYDDVFNGSHAEEDDLDEINLVDDSDD